MLVSYYNTSNEIPQNLSRFLVSQRKIGNKTGTGKQVTYIGYCYIKHNVFASLRSPVDLKSTFCFVVQRKQNITYGPSNILTFLTLV